MSIEMSWAAFTCAALLAGMWGCAASRAAEGLVLVEDGKSQYIVNVSESATPSELWAAGELQSYIEQMSGAQLPIDHGKINATPEAKIIYLGSDRAPLGYDWMSLGEDGYVIKTDGNKVIIAGGKQRGTMYGVFTLLEKLGVRWWTPTETFVPQMKTVKLPPLDIREVPRLEYRDMMYSEMFSPEGRVWAAHNKANGMAWADANPKKPDEVKAFEKIGGRYEFVGNLVHSYMRLLDESSVEIKPEMLALVGDRRTRAQPCLSNPDTVKALAAGVVKAFKAKPKARFVVVGQEDNRNYCRCPRCSALAEKEGPSGLVIDFANKVAEAVEKEIPGACLATAAYDWSRQPPKTLKPRDNVFITLCSIECDFAHPLATAVTEANVKFREDIVAWSKITRKLYIWDYVTNFCQYLMPHPNLDVLTANAKFFADHKAAGVFEEGSWDCWGSEFGPLRRWVLAKSLWNPDADGQALLREFLEGYYGPAADGLRKYIDAIHRPGRDNPKLKVRTYMELDAPYLSPAIMAEAEAALREAEAKVKGRADLERRVRHAHLPVWYVLSRRGPQSATWKAVEAKIGGKLDPAELAVSFAKAAEENKVNRVCEGAGEVKNWLEWLRDDTKRVGEEMPPEPQ